MSFTLIEGRNLFKCSLIEVQKQSKCSLIEGDNPSLMFALTAQSPNVGNMRETFFFNQMRVKYEVVSSKRADFSIDGNTFEVGGRKKGIKQIEEETEGWIVKDDIETGHGIFIPLWNFGMTY